MHTILSLDTITYHITMMCVCVCVCVCVFVLPLVVAIISPVTNTNGKTTITDTPTIQMGCDELLMLSALSVQTHGVSLDMAQLVVIGTSAVLAAVSAAAIPSAGLVTMVLVMQASPPPPPTPHPPLTCL